MKEKDFPLTPSPIGRLARTLTKGLWPNPLARRYGSKLYSHGDEELIIRDFFGDRRDGFFVDVGANHYRVDSTTYYLEKHLGWRGIAVDAVRGFEAGYLEHRKHTRFVCFFVSDKSDAEIEFHVTQKNYSRRSSHDRSWAKKYGKSVPSKVPTITLNDLLSREGVRKIDFLSVDLELGEPAALAGFDIERYRPALVCIEMHKRVKKPILEYFALHGYGLLEKYKDFDPANSYFAPRP